MSDRHKPDAHVRQVARVAGITFMAAAAGAVAALLFAPKSGKDTREEIRKRAQKTKQSASEMADDAKHNVSSKMRRARDDYEEAKIEAIEEKRDRRGLWGRK